LKDTSIILVDIPRDVCNPSPCGPNSQCRVNNNQAVCSCLSIFIGSPPACRPECVTSSDCPFNLACLNQKCQDPCPGSCGRNSNCRIIKHNPICSCKNGFTGDPFTVCFQTPGMIFELCLILLILIFEINVYELIQVRNYFLEYTQISIKCSFEINHSSNTAIFRDHL